MAMIVSPYLSSLLMTHDKFNMRSVTLYVGFVLHPALAPRAAEATRLGDLEQFQVEDDAAGKLMMPEGWGELQKAQQLLEPGSQWRKAAEKELVCVEATLAAGNLKCKEAIVGLWLKKTPHFPDAVSFLLSAGEARLRIFISE